MQWICSQSLESIPSTPVVKNPQEAVSLSCRGSGFNFGGYGMHWVREAPGKPLEHIGAIWYDASKTVYDTIVQGRIEITRDNSKSMVYLRLSNLKPEDSDTAVYYCSQSLLQRIWVQLRLLCYDLGQRNCRETIRTAWHRVLYSELQQVCQQCGRTC
uniref:Ig-like domain-containing protein n=1 Tax=Poecilia mexicana TaxID=48701 RepID=A0A3B3YFZ5_9TELE